MPPGTPPARLDALLSKPNPAVIATVRPDGELHTAATWYEWPGDGTVIVNMDASRRRLGHLRRDPRFSLTVLDASDLARSRQVTLIGRVREFRHDADLADIDRIARHYTGEPFHNRERDSWTAVLEVHRWYGWDGGAHMPTE
jgi:PPOX class probable F420-dependent enzyme